MRFALIDATGQVDNVIKADSLEVAQRIAAARGHTAREVVTELETPATPSAIVSRRCEPGARLIEREARADERARARAKGKTFIVDDFERAARPVESERT